MLPSWVIAFDSDLTENKSERLSGFRSRIVSLVLTAGLGLGIFDFNLDLAGGATPSREKVDAGGRRFRRVRMPR